MLLFCVVAGLLGHAAALEPMGVSDILPVNESMPSERCV